MSDHLNNLSRRKFFIFGFSENQLEKPSNVSTSEMIKMLTPDGKLVEVQREQIDRIANKQRATNSEILAWMKNPSKD